MAELLLVTEDHAGYTSYKDGDIIHAMNDLRIHFVHAEHICLSWNLDKKAGKWIDAVLAENYLAKIYQYKTERINRTEIRVTDQWTLESIVKGIIPNEYGNVTNVPLFFRRRLASVPHLVFGMPGAEIYYHGNLQYLADEDVYIWQQIEARTPNRKVDFGEFNWDAKNGKSHLQNYLAISVDDFDNQTRADLESSVYDDKQDPPVMMKKRKYNVIWRNLQGMTQKIIDDVSIVDVHVRDELVNGKMVPVWDGGVKVDMRKDFFFNRSSVVKKKPVLPVEL